MVSIVNTATGEELSPPEHINVVPTGASISTVSFTLTGFVRDCFNVTLSLENSAGVVFSHFAVGKTRLIVLFYLA